MKTLIILDVQNDFLPGGSLAVPNSEPIIPVINQLLPRFELVVATQDWHPANHKSFASNHIGKEPFEKIKLRGREQTLWPNHCVQGTSGAEFHPQLETHPIEAIFRKGTAPDIDSYSGFYDNDHNKSTGLSGYLKDKGADDLYFCGLCADICVYFSIKDALAEGFQCSLIEDATAPLNHAVFEKIREELISNGVRLIRSDQLI
ncbi:bifunctional nicotinamidase/pyrazinamidase [Legionella jamestowniensis]|uniref:nicotinamidase n=1 Tax=Legionella jamestowniensis TaxID=455 RepID=A0A0W0UJT9_9GAMM|nr:bifunctional nicotinamidase/pyrazinamidase [Legionella jamestowniensis]KTD08138.1 bifunctional pyrazinamidase/nicotinamidase [Legionella jamestowniensis]OCH98467.1 nicotinamidase [Legionella jamestowniensis]SFL99422.1 nicotinamidase/pyrazinamidase [Legionella jamestowniensis DSM 19215]